MKIVESILFPLATCCQHDEYCVSLRFVPCFDTQESEWTYVIGKGTNKESKMWKHESKEENIWMCQGQANSGKTMWIMILLTIAYDYSL